MKTRSLSLLLCGLLTVAGSAALATPTLESPKPLTPSPSA